MNFEFATAGKVVFGPGTVAGMPGISAGLGKKVLFVTGSSSSRFSHVIDELNSADLNTVVFSVPSEPTVALVERGAELGRAENCDHVVAVGGGSAIDAGKAISALISNAAPALDYLEVIGDGQPLKEQPVPFIAVPATAGTGAEVTKNAVLLSEEHKVKVSMRSPMMIPDVAIVDPVLTYSMPPHVTASTGLDALTQLIEGFVSVKATSITDGLAREGICMAASYLRRAYEDGKNAEAREGMALASLLGGLVLANAGLGAVHGFAGPLGGMYSAPHGVVCARLLPHVIKANIKALRERDPESPSLVKYNELASMLTGDKSATLQDGVEWVEELCSVLRVASLSEYGLTEKDYADAVSKAKNASSMKGNPVALSEEELTGILGAGSK